MTLFTLQASAEPSSVTSEPETSIYMVEANDSSDTFDDYTSTTFTDNAEFETNVTHVTVTPETYTYGPNTNPVNVTISLLDVYTSKNITITVKNKESEKIYTLNFLDTQNFTTTTQLPQGDYECIDIKYDSDNYATTCNNSFSVNAYEPNEISLTITETRRPQSLKNIFFNNAFLIIVLLGLCLMLAIVKKKQEL